MITTYNKKIMGYDFQVIKLDSGLVSFRAPMGEGKDKDMFDELVYYNQKIYNGKDIKEIAKNIRKFIKNWKGGVK